MERLYRAVQNEVPMCEESWRELAKICKIQHFEKGDFVLQEGEVSGGIYFISSGLVRNFYVKNDKEVSEWFAFDEEFCLSITSYYLKVPTVLAMQCLEDSVVITIEREGLDRLRSTNFEIANFAYELATGSLIISQERMASVQFETALQRYENLLKLRKTMLQRVPLRYIASFLGVSAETLSRIRSQIH